MATADVPPEPFVGTGIEAFDAILGGGLTSNRLYLIEGEPGTGKTTLAVQFLMEGTRVGQRALYVTLSETKAELESVAKSHGWNLDGIEIYELIDPAESLESASMYTMFEPAEVELGSIIKGVLEQVDKVKPQRVVFDSLSEMRLLAQSPLRYRRQVLALKQFFSRRNCTVMMLDDKTWQDDDPQLQSIAHGVFRLEHLLSEYGGERRRLRITKFRGRQFEGGNHDFQLKRGGLQVFPRTAPATSASHAALEQTPETASDMLLSGNPSLDALLGDGLAPGSSALLLGPAGVGKSSCATLYAIAAARRGEHAAFFIFEETHTSLLQRSRGLGMDLTPYLESGNITIHQMDPGELSPGEFAHTVREAVKPAQAGGRTSVVVIDSLNGYLNAMPHERYLTIQMHELLKYLSRCGVVTFLVVAQHGILGATVEAPVDASYLADSVILFRYFEASGEMRQAISVVKKRTGSHERTIREFRMAEGKIIIGNPLRDFHGVSSGTPTYNGSSTDLLNPDDA